MSMTLKAPNYRDASSLILGIIPIAKISESEICFILEP